MNKTLILVPTPLADDLPLEEVARKMLLEHALQENCLLLVEEHKEARRRWLKWGLPREAIDRFVVFNEHLQEEKRSSLIKELEQGKYAFLLSDGGMPAICDPGQKLIEACHRHHIKVTATPFPQSMILSLALSGFPSDEFVFQGFLPQKSEERIHKWKQIAQEKRVQLVMDTPYRLQKVMEEINAASQDLGPQREFCLAIDLAHPTEKVLRGKPAFLSSELKAVSKAEFVLLIGPKK